MENTGKFNGKWGEHRKNIGKILENTNKIVLNPVESHGQL